LRKWLIILPIIVLLFLSSCIEPPEGPSVTKPTDIESDAAYVLCEGLWGMDNSSLSRFSLRNNTIENDIYRNANHGNRLGDLASDIVVWKESALISITGTSIIEKIDKKTGKSLGRLLFEQGRAPRKLAVINDSLAVVSGLLNHSICFFNPLSMDIIKDDVKVGPAPEGIAAAGEVLLVVNSGYGDYLADKPKAGTISVVDIESMSEIGSFYAAPNPIELLVNKKLNRFYVSYNHLPSLSDSVGGIIEYDLGDMKELRRITVQVRSMCFSQGMDSLFFIGKEGIELINLQDVEFTSSIVIRNEKKSDIWYSLAIDNSFLWVGNAKNYQINGELLKYNLHAPEAPIEIFQTGINPTKILFY